MSVKHHEIRQSKLTPLLVVLIFFFTLFSPAIYSLDLSRLKYHLFSSTESNAESIFNDWKRLIEQNRKNNDSNALKQINDFFNINISFGTDVDVWKKNDYWATPMQTLAMRRGDCEDFAIAKYFSLVSAGMSEQKLRLMYVQATINGSFQQAHMVLAYYTSPDNEPLILDNINKEILPASSRKDLKPVYSLKPLFLTLL